MQRVKVDSKETVAQSSTTDNNPSLQKGGPLFQKFQPSSVRANTKPEGLINGH